MEVPHLLFDYKAHLFIVAEHLHLVCGEDENAL